MLVADFSAAVNLPRLSRVGGKWRTPRSSFSSFSLSGKKESVLGPGASELERTQSVRGRDESEEGKERLGLATLLH